MADPFGRGGSASSGGGGSSSSDPFGRGGGGGSTKRKKKPRGGALGILERTGSDLYKAAVGLPAGVFYLGKGLATDPVGTAEAVGKATYEDLRHPLRHPGNTLLTVSGLLSGGAGTVARIGAAGKALEAGGTAGAAVRAAAKAPVPKARSLRVGDLEVKPETSRSVLGAAAQRTSDKVLQKRGDRNPGGRAEARLQKKVGQVLTAQTRTAESIAKGPGAAIIALGRRLNESEQKALQVVAEQAPLEGRITAASARVIAAKKPDVRSRHQVELDLLSAAKEHLTVKDGKPAFKEKRLERVYDRMAKVAGDRETLLKNLGMLSDEAVQARTSKAGRVALGQALVNAPDPVPEIPGQLALINEPKPELFTAGADAVRIPDVATRRGARALQRGATIGSQGTIGKLRAPGSTTHEYTGALREAGVRRQDTTTLVGESSLEAAKYAGLAHLHEIVRQAASPVPVRADDIAVRLDNLKGHERLPADVRKFIDDPEEFVRRAKPGEAESVLDKVRASLFINPRELDPQAAAAFAKLEQEGKVGWVPRRILGDLAKPSAPLAAAAGKKAVRTVDTINNASRFAILYLKPAYAIPNLLGNAALTILQQGFAAPGNLARAARLNAKLGPEIAARIDAIMGEGFARAISAHGQGPLSTAVDKAASIWSKGVDTPFRRSSFIYEARRAGYKTPADLERLLTDPAEAARLNEIALRANREMIDYANLGPVEREVVRRVIFFYPWVKGSTVYAGRLVREHPVKAAVAGEIGQYGSEQAHAELGDVPSYLEGAFPVGGRIVNPNSAAILQTPATVGMALKGLITGDIPKAAEASQFLTPAMSLALAEGLRRNRSGFPYPDGTNAATVAKDVLADSLPQVTLARNLRQALAGQGKDRLYPPSVESALAQFLVGGLYPRHYNPRVLHEQAARER